MEDSSSKLESDCLNITTTNNEEEQQPLQSFEMELSSDSIIIHKSFSIDQDFHSMDALEILRESIRILRFNSSAFMLIASLLICPVSALLLSNCLVNQSVVNKLSNRLLLVAKFSGIPLKPLIKQLCDRLSEMALSAAFTFPFYMTFSLLAKTATVYSVDCTYLRKKFDSSKFFGMIMMKIWKRLVSTYLWVCFVIVGCVASFLLLMVAICTTFSVLGVPSYLITYPLVIGGLVFTVVFANAVIVCNLATVVTVLEDVSGAQALVRSRVLIGGHIQLGLVLLFMSTIGMAFLEGLFDHRVKTVSYGDGSSRLWEGPLLVMMYAFVVLIDYMMSTVFYFTCKAYSFEAIEEEEEEETLEEAIAPSSG